MPSKFKQDDIVVLSERAPRYPGKSAIVVDTAYFNWRYQYQVMILGVRITNDIRIWVAEEYLGEVPSESSSRTSSNDQDTL